MNIEFLKALGRCRVATKTMAQNLLKVSDNELEELLANKIISVESSQTELETIEYFTLTEKGEKVLKDEVPTFNEIYRGVILEHDLVLMEFYLKLSQDDKDSWLTRDDLIKEYKFPRTVDGAFINAKIELEAVEVLSKTAKSASVEKIEAFLKHVKAQKMNYLFY